MAYVLLDYSDGSYSARPLTDEEAKSWEAAGHTVARIEDGVLRIWNDHCDRDAAWQALWRTIDSALYIERKEKELLPLEDADREIQRLRAELERVQRSAKYFQEEWERASGLDPNRWHTAEARAANGYHCVFPQPGCNVDVLPPEWRDRAREILATYSAKHGGCCCGHEHRELAEATVAQLRNCGFIVEHDVEVDP